MAFYRMDSVHKCSSLVGQWKVEVWVQGQRQGSAAENCQRIFPFDTFPFPTVDGNQKSGKQKPVEGGW